MAGRATAILMDIIAKDGASAVLKKIGSEVKHTGDAAEKSGGGFSKFKAAGIAAGAAVGAAVIGFGKSSVDKFKEVGGETMTLMRLMGGTAETASRLRFAAQQSGVTFDTLSKSTGKFEKSLGGANDGGKKAAAMIKTLGFDFRDAQGHIRPMSDVLPQLAEKFKTMPNGAEKTALAMKLFGKSGADMIPFLNKGKVGINDLMKESDKFGNTLSGKSLDAIKKSKAGQREWNASLDGLKIQFGSQILPILNSFVGTLRDKVIPFVTKVTGFMQTHKDTVGFVAKAVGTLIVGVKAWSIAQGILNVVLAANPIGLVVIALAGLVFGFKYAMDHSARFRKFVTAAFSGVLGVAKAVAGWFTGSFAPWIAGALSKVTGAFSAVVNWVKRNWPLLLAIMTGPIGIAVLVITRNWDRISAGAMAVKNYVASQFNQLLGFFRGLPGRFTSVTAGLFNGIKNAFRSALNWVIGKWNSLSFGIPGFSIAGHQVFGGVTISTPDIPYFAKGGIATKPTLGIFGEAGPEALVPLGSGGLGGDTYNITVTGAIDPVGTGRAIVQAIKAYKLTTGNRALGIA